MFKWLVDIDVRKVMAVVGFMTAIELAIAGGEVPLDHMVGTGCIPGIKAWCGFLAFAGSLLTGTHGAAALFSPRDMTPAVKATLAFFAVMLVSALFVMPALAQDNLRPVRTLKPLTGFQTATATPAAAPSGDALSNFMAQLEKVTQDNIAAVIADIQLADADAGTIITPAIPASAATATSPAFAGSAAVVKDPIAHACYPAAVQFLQSIPAVAAPSGKFVGVQLFQAKRDFIAQLQAGLPTYLKLGCAPLLGDEINIAVQVFNMIGIKVVPAALTALMPALAPVTLPAMVLAP